MTPKQIAQAIEEWKEKRFINECVDKKTGELLRQKMTYFEQKLKPHLDRQAKTALEKFEKHCTAMRKQHGMTPFRWNLETKDRIEQALEAKRKLPKMRILDPAWIDQIYEREYLWPDFPQIGIKPEYEGENHPLEKNQQKRTAKHRPK